MEATLTARPTAEPARTVDRGERSAGPVSVLRGAAAGLPLPPAGRVYDEAAQMQARRQLVQRAAELRVPAPGAGMQGGPVVQRAWKPEVRPPPGGGPEDSDWFPSLRGGYRNMRTGETYDPDTRILDDRDEPFGLRELDEWQHQQLMQEIFGGAAVRVFVDDRDGRVYDPAARRESAGVLGRVRVLDADAHARRMEEIQADLDYREYVDSGEEDYDRGRDSGRHDALLEREYDDSNEAEHADAYEVGYARGYDLNRAPSQVESTFTVLRDGRYVDQDDRGEEEDNDRLFQHIGTELAYTFFLSVCTALAMYHSGTGLSFLAHNDSNNGERLAEAVTRYFETVREESGNDADVLAEIRTELYVGHAARSMNGESSADVVMGALAAAVGGDPAGAEFLENVRLIEGATQGDVVTVGGGEPPRVARADVTGSWQLDMAINLILQGRKHTDNGMSVLGLLNTEFRNASELVGDLDTVRQTVNDLLDTPRDFQQEMEEEIVALYNLKKEIAYFAERQ